MIIRTAIFYVLTFVFTIALGALMQAIGSEAIIPQLAPGLAALVLYPIFRQPARRLQVRLSLTAPEAQPALLAVVLPFATAVVIFLMTWLTIGGISLETIAPLPLGLVGLLWLPFGAFGEELGWRGHLHKTLDPKMRGIVSSVVVGVMWALWHVQLYANGPVYMVFLVLLMISYSIVLYVLMGRGFNVWIATLFHLAVNIPNLAFYAVLNEPGFMIIDALVWVVIAAITVALNRELFLASRVINVPSLAMDDA